MSTLEELLYEAVNENDVVTIVELLTQGANVNKLVNSGRSILGRAVQLGHVIIIEQLLKANVYAQTPESIACSSIIDQTIGKLNIDIADYYERSPVHYAAENGRVDILHLLLGAGCRVDVSDSENITPLHLAACRGHYEFVQLLLKAGCQINRKTSDKSSALHIAASRGYPTIVELLINYGAKIDALDASDRTPLFLAVSRANHDVVKVLIEHGTKVNTEEIHGYTPLAEAVWHKDIEMVRILLDSGAKITKSHYLLHYCVLYRNLHLVTLLLRSGCLVNVRDDSGDTPLHTAVRTGELSIIKTLIEYGANVNYPSGLLGTSPLHEAVEGIRDTEEQTFVSMLRLLIKQNCCLDAESFMPGDTPLYRAILLDKFAIAAALIRHGADVNKGHVFTCNIDNLCLAHRKGNFKLVKLLVYAGFNLHATPWLEILPSEVPHSYLPHTAKGWLIHVKKNPLTLSDLCRRAVRKQFGGTVYTSISSMVLPERIKRFLLLEDIE